MSESSDAITKGFEALALQLKGTMAPTAVAAPAATADTELTKAVGTLSEEVKKIAALFAENDKGEAEGRIIKAIAVQQDDLGLIREIVVGKDGNGGLLEAVARLSGSAAIKKSFDGDDGDDDEDEDEGNSRVVRKAASLGHRRGSQTEQNGVKFRSGLFDRTVHEAKAGKTVKLRG